MKQSIKALLLALLTCVLLAGCVDQGATMQGRYEDAVRDAVFGDAEEIMPLVSLTKEDTRVTWDEQGRVLLLTWHQYPDNYPAGESIRLEWGEVWTFTDREIAEKYAAEASSVTDWDLRLKQWIGLPPDSNYTTMTAFWVSPNDVYRPAYQLDPTVGDMRTAFEGVRDSYFLAWFQDNIIASYFDGDYPWTRLGYTYDWGSDDTEYGLTEFLVRRDAQVQVAFTKNTADFLADLATEAASDDTKAPPDTTEATPNKAA